MNTTQNVLEYAKQLLKEPVTTPPDKTKTIRYDLELPEEFHWKLVALGAKSKLDYETYAERVLKEFAIKATQKINDEFKQSIINELGKQVATPSNGGQS
jgi:hypothetical protein